MIMCAVGEIAAQISYTGNYMFSLKDLSTPGHDVRKVYIKWTYGRER